MGCDAETNLKTRCKNTVYLEVYFEKLPGEGKEER